jgi:ABC-type dipeptide/oligopeptide/nickel transport system ATPase component
MADLLEVRGLKTYLTTSLGLVKAVDGVSFDVKEGETVALVGESGCGKTMTALSIMRLIPRPQASIVGGEILFQGRDLLKLGDEEMRRVRGAEIAMIFQEPMTSLNPVLSIERQLTETLEAHGSISKAAAPLSMILPAYITLTRSA